MPHDLELVLAPEAAFSAAAQAEAAARILGIAASRIGGVHVRKRSIDARGRQVRYRLQAQVWLDEPPPAPVLPQFAFPNVASARPVAVVGCGPAGLFAALRLLEAGLKPIVLERGRDVRARRRDLAAIHRQGAVNPESNYCFGEGGAGTYSDGKLYTRSHKRGDIPRVLQLLVAHGAPPDILVDAHPHIGTNRLPGIVQALTETIRSHGGEVHFDACVDDIATDGSGVRAVVLAGGLRLPVQAVILATGHSARDVYRLLHRKGWLLEAKPFALGVRIEHPQALIDRIQYHCDAEVGRGPYLPAASYSLVAQAEGRGVFSFCMCPGGIIAPAATAPNEIVVNGWSPSKRNNPFANSGMVVAVSAEDWHAFAAEGPLAPMAFQAAVEQRAFAAGGGRLVAPAQRLTDFLQKRSSSSLPACSYVPGLAPVALDEVLPQAVATRLRTGLREFGRRMRGYVTAEAVLVAPESRTSAPVRIPRGADSLQHPQVPGLFPCGEGAGYAGGILSAAMDGERCAAAVAAYLGVVA